VSGGRRRAGRLRSGDDASGWWTGLAKLAVAIERDVTAKRAADTHTAALHTPSRPRRARSPLHRLRKFTHQIAVTKFHGKRDNVDGSDAPRSVAAPIS
jgi:hypothetical protein